jgi:hypothetical protein
LTVGSGDRESAEGHIPSTCVTPSWLANWRGQFIGTKLHVASGITDFISEAADLFGVEDNARLDAQNEEAARSIDSYGQADRLPDIPENRAEIRLLKNTRPVLHGWGLTMPRWILDWQDRSRDPARRVLLTADSLAEVRAGIIRLLSDETWTPPDAEEFKGPDALPAIDAFQRELFDLSDDAALINLWSGLTFTCDDGEFHIVRER